VVSFGTEGPGNSYRHNRVRETELFRHFLPYGHEYAHQDGSYGYGDFGRLPFDQADLVATLAPDRAIILDSNLNDFNDGAVTDNMSLELAKSVYGNLGANGDDFVKFNVGNYVSSGDPHGSPSAVPEGHYLSDLFYGTHTLTPAESTRLNEDPYALKVSGDQTQSPYDYYWGGYNTITGGKTGVSGGDGWYFSGFDSELASLRSQISGDGLNIGLVTALNAKLDKVVQLLAQGKQSQAITQLGTPFISQVKSLRSSGKLSANEANALIASAEQLVLYLNSTSNVVPAWSSSIVFNTGDRVTYNGSLYLASYWTQNQKPGDPNGPWQEIATDANGVAIWTASRIFTTGDVVSYQGKTWRAQWYTRNQAPGDPNGPWQEVAPQPADGSPAAWTPTTVYNVGDRVTTSGGQVYEARWWSRNQPPGDPLGPWKLVA
jgi:chitodextrinase